MTRRVRLAIRVSSSSRLRIDAEFAGDVRQRLERAGVVALLLEQPRVLERHRHVRAELAENHFVDFRELARRCR